MDEQALDLLRVRITNWATSRLRSRQGAEDVAQEVLLELTRKYPDKIHLEELLPLAYRIMGVKLNSAIRKRIKRGNDGSTESIELESPEQGAEESLLGKERKQLLFKVLEELDPECRELFGLQLDGLSQKAISERLGLPSGEVYTRSSRCRKKLRDMLSGALNDAPGEARIK